MEEIIEASKAKNQIIMFFGNYCAPCRMLKPVLMAFQGDDYDIHFVDVEANINLAVREGIRSVPTVYVYSGGNKVAAWKGYIGQAKIQSILNQTVKAS